MSSNNGVVTWSEFAKMDWLLVREIISKKRKYNEKLAEAINTAT